MFNTPWDTFNTFLMFLAVILGGLTVIYIARGILGFVL